MKISICNRGDFAINFLPETKEEQIALISATSNIPFVVINRDKQEKISVFAGHEFSSWNGVDLNEIVQNRFN